MPAPMDDKELRKYVEAFADGELDVQMNLRMLERMAMNPQATRRVMHQQELRKLVDRAMREQVPPVPPELRAKIEALAKAQAGTQSIASSTTPNPDRLSLVTRLRRWSPAIAAMILIGVGIYLWSIQTFSRPAITPAKQGNEVVKGAVFEAPIFRADLVESRRAVTMGNRHENCSKKIESLNRAEQFSKVVTEIPSRIADYLGPQIQVPLPDLTALGYEFRGAGACGLPGGKAVHLVYTPLQGSGHEDSLSLWIRADQPGQVDITEGKLYAATPEGSAHPILVWRRGNAVYYLVGDTSSKLSDAASALYAAR